jgi:uncharacterized protein (DUF697 family)
MKNDITNGEESPVNKITEALLKFISNIPRSKEKESDEPAARAKQIVHNAAVKASAAAGALALPPGPMGWITILPEILTVWKIQAQMVADIAAIYGKTRKLSRNQMLFCLFKHTMSQAMRDLAVRVGNKWVIRKAAPKIVQNIAKKIGVKITQRTASKSITRWVPIIGALGVSAYAYFDTAHVGDTAIDLFSSDIENEENEA